MMREDTTLECTLPIWLLLFKFPILKSRCLSLQIVGINSDNKG